MREPRFEYFQETGKRRQWRWRLKAANGKILCDCAEGFPTKAHARRNARRTMVAVGSIYMDELFPVHDYPSD